MKRVIVVFLGINMLLMFGCTKQVDTQADIQAIRQQGKGLVDAFNQADPDALAVFVTENVFVMPPNQQSVVGVEAVRAYWTEGFRVASSHLEISSEDLQVVGDWAIERFSWTVETQPAGGGARATDNGKGLWVWRRQSDGSWKLAQGINNSENPVPGTLWSGATGCMRANGQQKAGEDTSKGGFILQPEEGEVLRLGGPPGGQVIIKVDPAKTGSPQIAMGIQYVEGEIPVHQHEQEEEFLFVHRGRGVVVLGDERVSVQAGTTIYLPPGTWHGVQNTGDGPLQVMWVVTPGTGASTQLEKFFRAAGAPPGMEVKSLKPEQFADIMEKHGMKAKP